MGSRGFVLIFVLLTLVALAAMVGYLRLVAWSEFHLSRKPQYQREIKLSLIAFLQFCYQKALNLQEEENATETSIIVVDCSLEDFSVKASFSAENTRLNLNEANEEELRQFFEEQGIPTRRAQIMAASLLDWRDSDNEHRFNGAEKDYYRPLGYAPRNGPLKRLDEVVLVRGFDPYLFWIDPALYQGTTIYAPYKPEEAETLDLKGSGPFRAELNFEYHGNQWTYLFVFQAQGLQLNILFQRPVPVYIEEVE